MNVCPPHMMEVRFQEPNNGENHGGDIRMFAVKSGGRWQCMYTKKGEEREPFSHAQCFYIEDERIWAVDFQGIDKRLKLPHGPEGTRVLTEMAQLFTACNLSHNLSGMLAMHSAYHPMMLGGVMQHPFGGRSAGVHPGGPHYGGGMHPGGPHYARPDAMPPLQRHTNSPPPGRSPRGQAQPGRRMSAGGKDAARNRGPQYPAGGLGGAFGMGDNSFGGGGLGTAGGPSYAGMPHLEAADYLGAQPQPSMLRFLDGHGGLGDGMAGIPPIDPPAPAPQAVAKPPPPPPPPLPVDEPQFKAPPAPAPPAPEKEKFRFNFGYDAAGAAAADDVPPPPSPPPVDFGDDEVFMIPEEASLLALVEERPRKRYAR